MAIKQGLTRSCHYQHSFHRNVEFCILIKIYYPSDLRVNNLKHNRDYSLFANSNF